MLLLIDGYNITQPIAPSRNPDPRWLEKNRAGLLRDLTRFLPESVRDQTCVVFDAANPPPGRADRFDHQGIQVRFSVGYPTADDLLEQLIRAHHAPKRLMVVSSDHRVQNVARQRKARFSDSDPWMDALTDGKPQLAVPITTLPGEREQRGHDDDPSRAKKPRISSTREVADWMREFGFDADNQ